MSARRESPLVSTLVLNWNGAHLLPDCLATLATQDWPAHEILVVDNGSADDSAAVTARYPARWLPMGDNLGFTRAYNRAVRDAKGELLFSSTTTCASSPTAWAGSRVLSTPTRRSSPSTRRSARGTARA